MTAPPTEVDPLVDSIQFSRSLHRLFERAYSSAGESARLISVRSVVQIHLGPPATASATGAVAQLGERRPCKAEVVGSSPICSTTPQALVRLQPDEILRDLENGL